MSFLIRDLKTPGSTSKLSTRTRTKLLQFQTQPSRLSRHQFPSRERQKKSMPSCHMRCCTSSNRIPSFRRHLTAPERKFATLSKRLTSATRTRPSPNRRLPKRNTKKIRKRRRTTSQNRTKHCRYGGQMLHARFTESKTRTSATPRSKPQGRGSKRCRSAERRSYQSDAG